MESRWTDRKVEGSNMNTLSVDQEKTDRANNASRREFRYKTKHFTKRKHDSAVMPCSEKINTTFASDTIS